MSFLSFFPHKVAEIREMIMERGEERKLNGRKSFRRYSHFNVLMSVSHNPGGAAHTSPVQEKVLPYCKLVQHTKTSVVF